jgi:hypothetical protein
MVFEVELQIDKMNYVKLDPADEENDGRRNSIQMHIVLEMRFLL